MSYQEQFEMDILELKNTQQPIIIFGCDVMGSIGIKTITYFNKKKKELEYMD